LINPDRHLLFSLYQKEIHPTQFCLPNEHATQSHFWQASILLDPKYSPQSPHYQNRAERYCRWALDGDNGGFLDSNKLSPEEGSKDTITLGRPVK
jgi:hypothetical protein